MATARTGIERCAATPAMTAARPAWSGVSGMSKPRPCTMQPLPIGGAKRRCRALENARKPMISASTTTAPAPTRLERLAATPYDGTCWRQALGSVRMDTSAAPPASPLPERIDELWEARAGLSPEDTAARTVITEAVDRIDAGEVRVARVDADSD